MCGKNSILSTHELANFIEGWVHKQKGSFQILYESGCINPSINPKEYTLLGSVDKYGNRYKENL